jgi:hypothetical protein
LFRPAVDRPGTTCLREGGFVRNSFTVEHGSRKRDVEFLDLRIPNRDLGINDGIDDEAMALGGTFDGSRRPRKPARVSVMTSRRMLASINTAVI